MNNNKAEDILGMYSEHTLPDAAAASFEQWLSDETDYQRKTDAMKALWDSLPAGTSPAKAGSARQVLREAKLAEGNRSRFHPFMKVLTAISVAATLVLGVVTALLLAERDREKGTVCMVSSRDAKSDFVLPDGTAVWLNRNSRLYYDAFFSGSERRIRLEGEGYFDVYKDPSRPFVISSDVMEVRVKGTRFTMSTGQDGSPAALYLREGGVEAFIEGVGAVSLLPDQALVRDGVSGRWTKSAIRASNHTSWIGDKLVFYDTSLFDIVENLEHWYSVQIALDDEEAARRIRLSMTVRAESLDDILLVIKSMTRINFRYDNDNDKISISVIH